MPKAASADTQQRDPSQDGLQHYRFIPPPPLQAYIEHIWTLEADTGLHVRREVLVPNGRPGIIVCLGRPGTRTDAVSGAIHRNDTVYYGVATRPFVIEQQGRANYIGVEFKPYGLAAWAGMQQSANSVGALSELFGRQAVDELLHALQDQTAPALAVEHVITFLAALMHPLPPRDAARMAASIDFIHEQEGSIKTSELAERTRVSSSTLRRLFGRYIGTSPEQFISVMRYASFVKSLMQSQQESYMLAALHGYYDQAHATKDFKKYTGINQKSFLASYDGLARIMAEHD